MQKEEGEVEEQGVHTDVTDSEELFSSYVCRSIPKEYSARPHPGDVVEAASLGAVSLPKVVYDVRPGLPPGTIANGRLSALQLEGVTFASQRHCGRRLPSGERPGFFLGDGTGVGKGRQCAATVLNSIARGHAKHLWFSVSRTLRHDATRDVVDLGGHGVRIIDGVQELDRLGAAALRSQIPHGVLFCTYATLTSSGTAKSAMSRLDAIVGWCGEKSFNGCVIFDECHRAKNFQPGKEKEASKIAKCVIELQRRLPNARVLYCSATGVADIANCAFMNRLGLWGKGTAFKDYAVFVKDMKSRGVAALELLAMDMKSSGSYVSRTLGFSGCDFDIVKVRIDENGRRRYAECVRIWNLMRSSIEKASTITKNAKNVWSVYWSAHQRFFKQFMLTLKLPYVVEKARAALRDGHCVVIGLQTTGEASLNAAIASVGEERAAKASMLESMIVEFLRNHFPTELEPEKPKEPPCPLVDVPVPKGMRGGQTIRFKYRGVIKKLVIPSYFDASSPSQPRTIRVELEWHQLLLDPKYEGGDEGVRYCTKKKRWELIMSTPSTERVQSEVCVKMRDNLIRSARAMKLPNAPLDSLIADLGGPRCVAEMTGRRLRVCDGKVEVRVGTKGYSDDMNMLERRRFMDGKKLVAVISDAASTGISLHADRSCANQKRRVHYTLELAWSAEKAIQQLGRSHRSNSSSAPKYELVVSDLAGENRFVSAVASRLESLGAITRGDRRAASALDLSKFNFEGKYGAKGLRIMYDHLEADRVVEGVDWRSVVVNASEASSDSIDIVSASDFSRFVRDCVEQMGIAESSEVTSTKYTPNEGVSVVTTRSYVIGTSSRSAGVKRFLARLLGLVPSAQQILLLYFIATLDFVVREARRDGSYDDGIVDLRGNVETDESASRIIHQDTFTGTKTVAHNIRVDRGIRFEDALDRYWDSLGLGVDAKILIRSRGVGHVVRWEEDGRRCVVRTEVVLDGDETACADVRHDPVKETEVSVSFEDVVPASWFDASNDDDDDVVEENNEESEDTERDSFEVARRAFLSDENVCGFYVSPKKNKTLTPWVLLALPVSTTASGADAQDANGGRRKLTIVRPNTGFSQRERGLLFHYEHVRPFAVARHWRETYESSASVCNHGPQCTKGRDGTCCHVGRRYRDLCLISGAVTPVWQHLQTTLADAKRVMASRNRDLVVTTENKSSDALERYEIKRALQVVRTVVPVQDKKQGERKLVGVRFPPSLIPTLAATLKVATWRRTSASSSRTVQVPWSLLHVNNTFAVRFKSYGDSVIVESVSDDIANAPDVNLSVGALVEEIRTSVMGARGGGRVGGSCGLSVAGITNVLMKAVLQFSRQRRTLLDASIASNESTVMNLLHPPTVTLTILDRDLPSSPSKTASGAVAMIEDDPIDEKAKRRSLTSAQRKMTSFFSKRSQEANDSVRREKVDVKRFEAKQDGSSAMTTSTIKSAWSCPRCTLDNAASSRVCAVCSYRPPLSRIRRHDVVDLVSNRLSATQKKRSFVTSRSRKKKRAKKAREKGAIQSSLFSAASGTNTKQEQDGRPVVVDLANSDDDFV